MPDITAGRLKPARTLLLARAGLAAVTREGRAVTLGAMTPLQDLVDLPAPVGPCAANVADLEIRLQATVGGNLCSGEGTEAPRGDLQGPLLAVGARIRSAGTGGSRPSPLEDFLSHRGVGSSSTSRTTSRRRAASLRSTGPTPTVHRARRVRRTSRTSWRT